MSNVEQLDFKIQTKCIWIQTFVNILQDFQPINFGKVIPSNQTFLEAEEHNNSCDIVNRRLL